MKRTLLLFLTVCFVTVCLTLLFAACKVDNTCEHSFTQNTTAPDCTQKGVTVYTCSKCQYTYSESTEDALGHDYKNHDGQAPSCTNKGWEAYQTCTRCDYTTYKELPALNHDLQNHVAKSPSCTETGWEAYQACSRCDYTTYKELSALNHDLQSHNSKTPTCTNKGWEAYQTCSRCDYTTYKELPALNHDIQQHDGQAVTCTQDGWEAYQTCSRCDYTTYEIIHTQGHDLQSYDEKSPTCTTVGWNAYQTCSRGDYSTYNELSPTFEHSYEYGVCIWCDEPSPTNGYLNFTLKDDGTYEVNGNSLFAKTAQQIVLPSLYNKKFVTSVASSAFANFTAMTSIIIPDSILTIGDKAFENCDCTTIYCRHENAVSDWNLDCPVVWNCTQNDVADDGNIYIIRNKIRYALINDAACVVRQPKSLASNFNDSLAIDERILYDGNYYDVKTIIPNALESCGQLTEIIVPSSISRIGAAAFKNCASLESIVLPFIGESLDCTDNSNFGYIFGNVPQSLKSVTITGGTIVRNSAFSDCEYLTSVSLPDSITVIKALAFARCSSLESMVIPANVKTIEIFAFSECSSLSEVILPDGLEVIQSKAFFSCGSLESVFIPSSVWEVGFDIFVNNSQIVIYCELSEQPSNPEWNVDWNSNRPVIWGASREDLA